MLPLVSCVQPLVHPVQGGGEHWQCLGPDWHCATRRRAASPAAAAAAGKIVQAGRRPHPRSRSPPFPRPTGESGAQTARPDRQAAAPGRRNASNDPPFPTSAAP